MRVRDWMSTKPLTRGSTTPVLDALQLLASQSFRRLPVVDNNKLVGMVTDKDLKDAMPSKATTLSVWEMNYLLSKLTIGEVMASPVYTIYEDQNMEDAALVMQQRRVGGLPVLNRQGDLVGIITITDVLKAFTQIMGLNEDGTRVTLNLPDQPGALAKATEVIQPNNIQSLVTVSSGSGNRQVVLRISDPEHNVRGRLEQAGLTVLD